MKDCWSTEIKSILGRNSLGQAFSSFPFDIKSTIDTLQKSLLLKDQTKWKTHCKNMPKLRTYVKLDDFFCNKEFLFKPLSFIQRKFLTKFRLGVLPIRIETGRYERPRVLEAERTCLVCNDQNAVENEHHYLLHCSLYNRLRGELFSKVHDVEVLTWDDDQKFKYLTCNPQIVKSTAQFLISAHNLRSTKL